jgi:hypothetical protein
MRATVWLTVSALTLALAGCSPKAPTAPSPPAVPSPPAPPTEPATPAAAPLAPAPPSAENDAPTGSAATVVPVAAAAPRPFHFSPDDFPRQEHRIAALIANAETRDATGGTHHMDEQAHAQRVACPTRACVEQSYAAEEAYLRKWEGSADVR